MYQRLQEFKRVIEKELGDMLDQTTKAGTVSSNDVECINNAVKLMLDIQDYEKHLMNEGAELRSYGQNYGPYYAMPPQHEWNAYAHGGQYYAPDRYNSYAYEPGGQRYAENGHSGHSISDRMVASLESMYDQAKTDHERQVVDQWIKRIRTEV